MHELDARIEADVGCVFTCRVPVLHRQTLLSAIDRACLIGMIHPDDVLERGCGGCCRRVRAFVFAFGHTPVIAVVLPS
jgi:hypothetical protein